MRPDIVAIIAACAAFVMQASVFSPKLAAMTRIAPAQIVDAGAGPPVQLATHTSQPHVVTPPMTSPHSGQPRLAVIRARGELLVCIWPEYYAISWRNPRNGEMEGLDAEMAQALADRLGVRLQFVETHFVEFLDRLEQGDCDIAMMGVGISPERSERVAFSKPYLGSPIFAVTTRDSPRVASWADMDRPGHVIAVAAGTIQVGQMRGALRAAELLVVSPPASREAEVLAGRADAFVSDFAYTRGMQQMHGWAHVMESPDRFGDTLFAYAVARYETAWLAEVDAFLAAAKADGLLARLAERYGLTSGLVR
ncbi:substrate-binding periplasmic protein [Humitalea sp. 24SJ18S-53]|uniref:substrate-binding periplasmic protein n=1 Tax=Humitalea sp. 24SJ18S-53 TaxID=3422307 RepID=UPI003D664354